VATPTISDQPATQRQYVTQLALSAAVMQAIRTLWASTTPLASEDAWEAFSAAVRAVMPRYGQTAGVVALDNYRAARRAAGITTTPTLPRIPEMPASKIDAGLDWARRAMKDIAAEQAGQLAEIETKIRARAEAAMQKALLDEARETTIEAVVGDDKALGYRRVPRPDACAWCLALATRTTSRRGQAVNFTRYGTPGSMGGDEHWGVYKSRAAAGQTPIGSKQINRFHNNCHCVVEPIFSTDFEVPEWLRDVKALYSDADNFNHFRRIIEARRRGQDVPDPTPIIPAPSAQPAQVAAIADLLGGIDAAMRAA